MIAATTELVAQPVASTPNTTSAFPDAPRQARAQSSSISQEPVFDQNTLPGYTHVRGGTPPPAYSPDAEPIANNNATSSDSRAAPAHVTDATQSMDVAVESNLAESTVSQAVENTGNTNEEPIPSTEETPSTTVRPAKRARQTDQAEPRTRKAPKRNSTRSNATVQSQLEDSTVAGPSQTPRRPPVARMMAAAQDPTEDENMSSVPQAEDAAAAPKKTPAKRKPRKVKTPARVDEEEPREGQEGEPVAAKPKKPRKPRQKAAPKPRTKKSVSEEAGEGETQDGEDASKEEPESDPELHEIDPEALSMYTITKQKRYGKTSEREKKMAEIDWDDVKRRRRAEAEGLQPESSGLASQKEQGTRASTGEAEGSSAPDQQQNTTRAVEGGLGFRVVNGEIVEDEETLQIDRRAQAQAEIAMQAPVEEENDLTRFHNRATYMNDRKRDEKDRVPMWKSKSDPWSEDETDRFYEALKNWGTDFMIISQLFPPKTRAQIKKKFNREERIDPERVTAALLGKDPVRMDLNAYALAANLDVAEFNKFDSLEHAQSLISESMKDKEEAMRIAVKEAEETERQRAVHEAGKKKGREGAEERKRLAQAKKAMRSKGMVWGAGTFGGFGGGDDEGAGES